MNEQEQMQFFREIFDSSLLRLGPGNEASTLRALKAVLAASHGQQSIASHRHTSGAGASRPRVLDLGCGTGAQSLVLAQHLAGPILAIDNYQPYLEALRRRADAAGVAGKIATSCEDMRTLEYDQGAFDLIWSEGALYCMGFREGLGRTRRWLAEDGCLALTELCWLKANPPSECRGFFESQYPVMTDVDGNLSAIKASGYTILDHFILPESAWADEYYKPIGARLISLRRQYAGDDERLSMIESMQTEIDMYHRYSEYYGYIFCVMQR